MVEAGGPAEKGGIKVGDIILKFNNQPIETTRDLPRLVGATKVGSRATVTVWRRGTQLDVPVTVVELQDEKAVTPRPVPKKPAPGAAPNALGLVVSDITPAQRAELGAEAGVLVENADGAAATAGIRAGDVISQVGNTPVTSAGQFNALVGKLDPKKPVALLVRRENVTQYVVVKPRQ
jgi:serine protease Do